MALIGHVTITDSNHHSKLLNLYPGSLFLSYSALYWKLKKLDHYGGRPTAIRQNDINF